MTFQDFIHLGQGLFVTLLSDGFTVRRAKFLAINAMVAEGCNYDTAKMIIHFAARRFSTSVRDQPVEFVTVHLS